MFNSFSSLSYKTQDNGDLVLRHREALPNMVLHLVVSGIFVLVGGILFLPFNSIGDGFIFLLFFGFPLHLFITSLWNYVVGKQRIVVRQASQSIHSLWQEIGRFKDIAHIKTQSTTNKNNRQYLIHIVTHDDTLLWSGYSANQKDIHTVATMLSQAIGVLTVQK